MAVGQCEPGCKKHYGCMMREKGLQFGPSATPTVCSGNPHPTPQEPPAYNREIMYSHRPGGTKVPLINPTTGYVVRRKEYESNRRKYEAIQRAQRSAVTAA